MCRVHHVPTKSVCRAQSHPVPMVSVCCVRAFCAIYIMASYLNFFNRMHKIAFLHKNSMSLISLVIFELKDMIYNITDYFFLTTRCSVSWHLNYLLSLNYFFTE